LSHRLVNVAPLMSAEPKIGPDRHSQASSCGPTGLPPSTLPPPLPLRSEFEAMIIPPSDAGQRFKRRTFPRIKGRQSDILANKKPVADSWKHQTPFYQKRQSHLQALLPCPYRLVAIL
jgi:hypothetical protein